MKTASPLTVERTYDAPIATIWSAITEEKSIRQWMFKVDHFQPVVGHEFHFDGVGNGVTYKHICVVKEVTPQKRLVYSWRYEGHEGNSLVTIELSPLGSKTKFKLTHEGLETFPKTEAFKRENFVGGWNEIVGNLLKDFVEKP